MLMSYIPLSVTCLLGNMLGFIIACIPTKRHSITIQNIKESLIGKHLTLSEVKKLASRVYMHFGRVFFMMPHILRLKRDNLHKYCEIDGAEYLINALKEGKGVLALTAHIGNWELCAVALTITFGRVAAIARPFHNQVFNLIMQDMRTRFGMEVIPKQNAMRRVMTALKKNMIIGVLLDQNVVWQEGEFLSFLGRTATANKGLALLALKTGAPVLPLFSIEQPDGRYKIHIGKPVTIINTGDKTSDVENNTLSFTRLIEEQVVNNPTQWFWFHRRWKTLNYCPLPEKIE